MLEYNRIDLSEGIDVNKISNSRECSFCHYYFLDINIYYQKYLCDGCHDLSMKANNIQNKNAYRIHFWNMSKDYAINNSL